MSVGGEERRGRVSGCVIGCVRGLEGVSLVL